MAIDWTKIYDKYKGLWVALQDDQVTVISSAQTLKEALEKAQEKGYKQPIMFKVPSEIIPFVGGFRV